MSKKKYTKNNVLKGLKCCIDVRHPGDCVSCPFVNDKNCAHNLMTKAYDFLSAKPKTNVPDNVKLGKIVYTVSGGLIERTSIYAIGETSFVVEMNIGEINYYMTEYYFEDYGETWFTTLNDAKQYIKDSLADPETVIFRKHSSNDDIWIARTRHQL